ncbi:MAG TPA: TolC family protein [Longimicrobium sp.]|jgi:outer membrane protein
MPRYPGDGGWKGAVCIAAVGTVLATAAAGAQQPAIPAGPRTLSLEAAAALAREHNPAIAEHTNDSRVAGAALRAAYGDLLPTLNLSNSLGYTASGERRIGSVSLGDQPSVYSSSFNVGASYGLTASRLLQPRVIRAETREAEGQAVSMAATVQADVTRRYLAVLQAQARLHQAEREIVRAGEYVRQGNAQAAAGLTSPLDRTRAQVQLSQSEIRRMQARRTLRTEVLALGRVTGVMMDPEVELTSTFALFEPKWTDEELVQRALAGNPSLNTAELAVGTARARTTLARAASLPTLSFSVNAHGWIQRSGDVEALIQQRLGRGATPEQEAAIRERVLSENDGYPFNYNRQPVNAALTLSVPVFQGFARRASMERSRAALEDASLRRRAEQVRVYAEVATAATNLRASYELARAHETVRGLATEEVRLAEQRMRMGSGSILLLTDAQTRLGQAELDEIDAVYAFHLSLAELQALVGTPLR